MNIGFEKLTDLALKYGLVPDKYFYHWDKFGIWQLNVLKEYGLKPNNKIIDIGCGAMRFGVHAVKYLDDKNYSGVDGFKPYIPLSMDILEELKIKKRFSIKFEKDFNFSIFNQTFDFAVAQSVFTHLSKKQIESCLKNLKPHMNKKAKFIFTYLNHNTPRGFYYYGDGNDPMISSQKINSNYLNLIAEKENLKFYNLNKTNHPSFQEVGCFEFY